MTACWRWLPRTALCSLLFTPIWIAASFSAQQKTLPLTRLSAGGKALIPVVVSADAPPRVRQAAQSLSDTLGRMSGAKFVVVNGDGKSGIAVGLPADFPALPFKELWNEKDPTQTEDYLLRSHSKGIYAIGASELAVEHAVWDLLYRLGYRQFFPGETWEVVPKTSDLRIAVDDKEHPAFYSRRIWYGFGVWDYSEKPYADWCARNRATQGITLSTGHAYDAIIAANKAAFDAHPEYLGLVGGQRTSSKFCISNPELRKLIVNHALAYFQQNPDAQSISMEPSDGGGWCECERCAAMGSVSDRALTLVNEVTAAVDARFGEKFVGMYAYNQHSPPPHIKVHPQVVISVATAFIKGGYTVDELIEGWRKQGAVIGVREYYSVNTWDRDLPGQARGANLNYLQTTIPHFYEKGARFISAESSDNWGCNGLGYYLAARMLWDVNEAQRMDALVADFLDKAFGPAKEPMAEFYQLIDGSNQPLLSDDLIGRMYRSLAAARKLTNDPHVQTRINDLILYTRYVELFTVYSAAKGEARQKSFENLIRHAYRMRKTMTVHAKALYRDLPRRDKFITVPPDAEWNVPEGRNPWKSSEPFTQAELDNFVTAGIENHRLIDFNPATFSNSLIPAAKLNLPNVPTGSTGLYWRGVQTFYTWLDQPGTVALKAKGGIIYDNLGDAKIAFYPSGKAQPTDNTTIAPDKQEHEVKLKTTSSGLHRIEVSDHSAGTSISWQEGTPMTLPCSKDAPLALHGRADLYFYVPKGTRVVGGYADGLGMILNASGERVHTFDSKPGYFSVPVAAGQDGRLWKLHQGIRKHILMTVPPYVARSARELLLPVEVVEADALKK